MLWVVAKKRLEIFSNDQPIRYMNTPLEDGSERCLYDYLYEAGQVMGDEEMYSATLRQDLELALLCSLSKAR